jgi:hypothetical protein
MDRDKELRVIGVCVVSTTSESGHSFRVEPMSALGPIGSV